MSKATLSNYDLTAAQVAAVMNDFIYSDLGAREELRRHRANVSNLSSKTRARARKVLRIEENNLNKERSQMILETEHLYEDALAHLLSHACAVEPGYLEEIKNMLVKSKAGGEPPIPLALSEEKVQHYSAILEITRVFLHAMGSRMGNWDSHSPR